jgi:hypothetical protein
MKLKLKTSRKGFRRVSGREELIVFAVVDLDKAEEYPANFVCMLPQLDSKPKPAAMFSRIFGDKSLQTAKKLLSEALVRENDPKVKTEIKKRLKALEPKSVIEIHCKLCGSSFQPKLGRHQQRICQTCRTKNQTAQ